MALCQRFKKDAGFENETTWQFALADNIETVVSRLWNITLIKKFVERYGYASNFVDDHYRLLGDPSPKNNIFQNENACAQVLIDKHNNIDLPYFYKLFSNIRTLPSIHKLRITSLRMIRDIEQSVKDNISTNEIFDLRKPKVLVLSMLTVKSLIEYYNDRKEKGNLKRSGTAALSGESSQSCRKLQCLD